MIPTTRVLRMRIYPLWNDVRVSLTAAVERAHSDRARSGSKRLTRASFQSTFLCAGGVSTGYRPSRSMTMAQQPHLHKLAHYPLPSCPSPSA